MIKFLVDIITKSSGKSHKRLISLMAFFCLIVCLVLNAFGIQLQTELILAFAGIVTGESVMTLFEKKEKEPIEEKG